MEVRDYECDIEGIVNNANGEFKTAILNTMQTPALFALKNNIFEGEAKEAMIARLRENFAQHGNCLQTGFLGTSILMGTLTDNGMVDIAYELLFQRKNPSWLYSVDNGATTIWERWNSYMIENGMGPRGMNSFNHNYLNHSVLTDGADIVFNMSATPNMERGTLAEDAPYSFTNELAAQKAAKGKKTTKKGKK